MLEPWNDSSILPPPVQTLPHNSLRDVHELLHITKNIIKILNKQSPLHQESALMKRFLYKFDKKFRNDLGYRAFKKVNTAINKLFKLNFLKEIENFNGLFSNTDEVYLPSKQMLEYLLVRILTFSKILLRMNICSKQAAIFYLDRVKRGESHWMSLVPYALLSRIWSITLVLLQNSCSWYSNLLKFTVKTQKKGLDFIPETFKLPLDLREWLDMDNLDCQGRFQWTVKKTLNIDPNMLEDEVNTYESILGYVGHINSGAEDTVIEPNTQTQNYSHDEDMSTNVKEDCGQEISRESFRSFFNIPDKQSVSVRKVQTIHSPACVINKKTLQKFIHKEESLRIENDNIALTSHLSFMQWQSLKASLTHLLEMLCSNKKLEKKFRKIWQEKCLDYC